MEDWQPEGYLCSFCARPANPQEWRHIICGPAVYICSDCIALCVEFMKEAEVNTRAEYHYREIGWTLGTANLAWEYDVTPEWREM